MSRTVLPRQQRKFKSTGDTKPETHSIVLPERRNIFDNDDFDVFSGTKMDMSRVVFGKKE